MPRWPIHSAVVAVAGLVGLSLTKTPALQHESGTQFFLSGALIGLLAIGLHQLVGQRVQESLPPTRLLRGLKLFTVGLLLALGGWLVSAFVKLEYGLPFVVAGTAVGACGMAYHYYLLFTRGDA